MQSIRISVKEVGTLALPGFCPRCFWIKLHCNYRLPYQIFPGIFSSIDSFTKKIITMHFERHGQLPNWIDTLVPRAKLLKLPHHSVFFVTHEETNIILTGVPDVVLQKSDGSYFIIDYKTAKYTETQDSLLPLYKVQLNGYAYIAERIGFSPVSAIGLIYLEPLTQIGIDDVDTFEIKGGFSMHFLGKLLPLELNQDIIPPLLKRAREIYELPQMPNGKQGCRDCELLQIVTNVDPMSNLIQHGREERYLEYKQIATWDAMKQKIVKTAMGMANIKGGGWIIIGVRKVGEEYVAEGMLEEDLITYSEDGIQAYLNRFADPYVETELQEVQLNGKKFLSLKVSQFTQLPIICKRDCDPLMREGAIYTRSYRIPETCEVRSQNEMREIMEMAAEKGMLNLLKTRGFNFEQ
jgi:hypothetical protein